MTRRENGGQMTPGEPRVWQERNLWLQASTSERLLTAESNALTLGAEDPVVGVNYHDLRLGQQKLLHGEGDFTFAKVQSIFGFSRLDFWDHQRAFLLNAFRKFYPEDEEAVGWPSLTAARRPATRRSLDDPDVLVEEFEANSYELCKEPELELIRQLPLAIGLYLPTKGLRFACKEDSESARRQSSVFQTVVRRRVQSPSFGVDHWYHESWLCLGRKGEDENRLRLGQIPAMPEPYYEKQAVRVRTTPILTLCKVSRSMEYSMVAIEINPASGETLSIRSCSMPLAAALLSGSKVEQEGIRKAFRKIGG